MKAEPLMDLLLLSRENLKEAGLDTDILAVVKDVKKALVKHASGESISDKVALAPSRERMYDIWDLDAAQRRHYDGVDLDQKLSSLNALDKEFGSVKLVGATALNAEKSNPRSESLIVLYAADTIRPKAIMHGTDISALRTGAYAAIVAEYALPWQEENVLASIGTGKIGEANVLCLDAALKGKIKQINICSKHFEEAQKFVKRMQSKVSCPLVPMPSVKEGVKEADFIVTATSSLTPLFEDQDLKRNVCVLILGGDEAPESFIYRAYSKGLVLCDDWYMVKHRNDQSLPFMYFRHKGKELDMDESKFVDLPDLLTGKFDVSEARPECVFVNCVGLPPLDLEIAQRVYKKAVEKGIGTKVVL